MTKDDNKHPFRQLVESLTESTHSDHPWHGILVGRGYRLKETKPVGETGAVNHRYTHHDMEGNGHSLNLRAFPDHNNSWAHMQNDPKRYPKGADARTGDDEASLKSYLRNGGDKEDLYDAMKKKLGLKTLWGK